MSLSVLNGQSLEVKRKLAYQFLSEEQFEKSLPYFLEVYKKDDDVNIYESILEVYLILEDYTNAEKHVKKRLRKFKGNQFYAIDLATVYGSQDKSSDEKNVLNQVVKNTPLSYDRIIQVSNKLKLLKYYEWSLKILDVAAKRNPNYPFSFEKAELYLLQGKIPLVYQEYFEILDKNDAYLEQVKGALQTIINDDIQDKRRNYLKKELLKKVQERKANVSYSDLLIWLFIQEKEFSAALVQSKALDKRLEEGGQRVYMLAKLAEDNFDDAAAIQCYDYLISLGKDYFYYHSARVRKVELSKKVMLAGNYTKDDLISFEKNYYQTLNDLGNNPQSLELKRELALFQSFYLEKMDTAISLLKEAITKNRMGAQEIAKTKLVLGDVLVYKGEVWDAVLYYGQVETTFKHDVIGHEAKLKKSKVYFYSGDFDWAKSQLDVLKASTSKLIANDALSLSLLISDNITIDTTTALLRKYAQADLLYYQKQHRSAIEEIDSLMKMISISGDVFDDALMLKGRCLLGLKEYTEAIKVFEKVYQMHTAISDDALLMMARIQENKLSQTDEAKELYKKLLLGFPGSVHSIIARKRYRFLRGDLADTEDINFLYDQNLEE
jgi:tetratricopeptide (TPR) repeat protein